jgi:hypothetical protein
MGEGWGEGVLITIPPKLNFSHYQQIPINLLLLNHQKLHVGLVDHAN